MKININSNLYMNRVKILTMECTEYTLTNEAALLFCSLSIWCT